MVRYQHPFPKAANYDASDPYDGYGLNNWRQAAGLGKHRGVDYNGPAAYLGAAIPAIADGVVAEINSGLGNRVVIAHPDGVYSGYAHMRYPTPLSLGQSISRGQTVGNVGDTGADGAVHLHLTMANSVAGANGGGSYWVDHFDPIPYIDQRLNAPENGDDMAKSYPNRADYRTSFTLAAGASSQLKTTGGVDANIAELGDAGRLVTTAHVYANAPAGAAVDITFLWQTASSGAISSHYTERAVAGGDGKIRANPTFQRNLSSGQRVFLRVEAPSTNSGTITVTDLYADATLFQ